MTLTEAQRYMEKVYLEQGWITPEQIRDIKRDSLIKATSLLVLVLGLVFIFLVV